MHLLSADAFPQCPSYAAPFSLLLPLPETDADIPDKIILRAFSPVYLKLT